MQFIITWIVTSIATAAAIAIVPGIAAVGDSMTGAIACALALALVNAFIKPFVEVLSLPLTVVTLGFFHLVINALMLELAGSLSVGLFGSGIEVASFGAAFFGSIVISIASTIVGSLFGEE